MKCHWQKRCTVSVETHVTATVVLLVLAPWAAQAQIGLVLLVLALPKEPRQVRELSLLHTLLHIAVLMIAQFLYLP